MLRDLLRSAKRAKRYSKAVVPQVQELETRALLAGVVSVEISDNGDIKITGDSKSNQVDVTLTGDGVTIVGTHGTKVKVKFDGETETFDADEEANLEFPTDEIRSVKIDLKNGHDDINFIVDDAAVAVEKNVDINLGSGRDFVAIRLINDAFVSIGGNLTINAGVEDDQVGIIVDESVLTVDGNATIDLGTGNDVLLVGDAAALDDVGIDGEPADFDEDEDNLVDVDGTLTIRGSSGEDIIGLAGVSTGLDLKIDSGADKDKVGAYHITAGRDLSVTTGTGGDRVAGLDIAVGRNTTVDTGVGNDLVAVDGLDLGFDGGRLVRVNLGAGEDDLAIGDDLVIGDDITSVRIDGSSQHDDFDGPEELEDFLFSFDHVNPGGTNGDVIAQSVIDAINAAVEDFFIA